MIDTVDSGQAVVSGSGADPIVSPRKAGHRIVEVPRVL